MVGGVRPPDEDRKVVPALLAESNSVGGGGVQWRPAPVGQPRTTAQESTQEPSPDLSATTPDHSLPPLDEELQLHCGPYLYGPGYDKLNMPEHGDEHHCHVLRLPESWSPPRPWTAFQEFLGPDPIHPRPGLKWFGEQGFQWEPRFVAY